MKKFLQNLFFAFLAKDAMSPILKALKTDPEVMSKVIADKISLSKLFNINSTNMNFNDTRQLLEIEAFTSEEISDGDSFGGINDNVFSDKNITLDKWLTVTTVQTREVLSDKTREAAIAKQMKSSLLKGLNDKIVSVLKTAAGITLSSTTIEKQLFIDAAKTLDQANVEKTERVCFLGSETAYELFNVDGFIDSTKTTVAEKQNIEGAFLGKFMGFDCYNISNINDKEVYFAGKNSIIGLTSTNFVGFSTDVKVNDKVTNKKELVLEIPFKIKELSSNKIAKAIIA